MSSARVRVDQPPIDRRASVRYNEKQPELISGAP